MLLPGLGKLREGGLLSGYRAGTVAATGGLAGGTCAAMFAGMAVRSFEWSATKARVNLRKHGVSFEEGATVFGDPWAMFRPDPDHSVGEWRYLVLGMSHRQRLLIVAYAERPPRTRLISARRATRTERSKYEEEDA